MQIECKLHRPGGTEVTLGSTNYHFTPLADGAHVAEVEDEKHQDRFLSISEAYRLYRGKADPVAPVDAPAAPAVDPEPAADPVEEPIVEPIDPGEPLNPADANGDGTVDNAEERAALAKQYEAKVGKKPHYNLSIEKMRAAIEG